MTLNPSQSLASSDAIGLPEPAELIRAGRGANHTSSIRLLDRGLRPLELADRPGPTPDQLRICILAPRVDVGGGARILLEHANRLSDRGHDVLLLSHFPEPDWFQFRARYRHVPAGHDLAAGLPPCDLVICGYWDQVPGAVSASVAPVVHFEQGDFHLFEDIDPNLEDQVRGSLRAANATLAVSSRIADILSTRYGVEDVDVVHNAVDPAVFHTCDARSETPYVLCVGWDGNDFKGISEVRQVWDRLSAERPELRLVWVTPKPPRDGELGTVVISPPQDRLGELYRGAAVFLCASRYESFPLPPLEAMACGTPVVTTANVGVLEYADHGENALVVPIRDVDAMVGAVSRVLDDPSLADQLREGGLKTAQAFSWDRIIDGLEHGYRTLSQRCVDRSPMKARSRSGPKPWKDILPTDAQPSGPWSETSGDILDLALDTTDAGEVWVPVARPLSAGLHVYRWEVAARRSGAKGTTRVFAPHSSDQAARTLPYQNGLDALLAGHTELAVARLAKAFETSRTSGRQGAVVKWLAIALARGGRVGDALALIEEALGSYPDNPDYLAAWSVVSILAGRVVDFTEVTFRVGLLGQGTRYDDWLAEPMALAGDGFDDLLLRRAAS